MFAIAVGGLLLLLLFTQPLETAWLILPLAVLAAALLSPSMALPILALAVPPAALLFAISEWKIRLIGLPLTMLDIRIAIRNPSGLWDALGWPHWSRLPLAWTSIIALAAALGWFVISARRRVRGAHAHAGPRAFALVVIALLVAGHAWRTARALERASHQWEPAPMVALARKLGPAPFLMYTHWLERRRDGLFFTAESASPPSSAEIEEASRQLLHDGLIPAAQSPNIVVVLAESTFDPAAAFALDGAWDSSLFRTGEGTHAVGPLLVNAVGGGTWITEFESIVGIDSRLFGYWGYYTHGALAPFVRQSLASWLSAQGYHTQAFFPHGGEFYAARAAYQRYGFHEILDVRQLGFAAGWVESDTAMVERVLPRLALSDGRPTFAYVMLIENHAPHNCRDARDAAADITFAGIPDSARACQLQEYLRRLASTSEAVRRLRSRLAAVERETGRPFVLLVFGDHQPHTFTRSGASLLPGSQDFSGARKGLGERSTFYHLISSTAPRVRCCGVEVAAWTLPTLLSSYVTTGTDSLYLPLNLWLHSKCGADVTPLPIAEARFGYRTESRVSPPECLEALGRAINGYRQSGVIDVAKF